MNKSFSSYTDNELLSLLRESNLDAYREVYDRYHACLYIHALKRLRDKEECRDIIQNIFINLWEKRAELNIENNLSGYLYTSVRNAVFNLLVKNKLKQEHIQSINEFSLGWSYSTDFLVRENQLKILIDKEIELLPKRTREIFKLSRRENLSHKEIGAKLLISEQTVKTTINNALKILRVKLGSFLFYFF